MRIALRRGATNFLDPRPGHVPAHHPTDQRRAPTAHCCSELRRHRGLLISRPVIPTSSAIAGRVSPLQRPHRISAMRLSAAESDNGVIAPASTWTAPAAPLVESRASSDFTRPPACLAANSPAPMELVVAGPTDCCPLLYTVAGVGAVAAAAQRALLRPSAVWTNNLVAAHPDLTRPSSRPAGYAHLSS